MRNLLWPALFMALLPGTAHALPGGDHTGSLAGFVALVIFVIAYAIVIGEEFLHLRKSKPVIVAAGAIWVLVAMAYAAHGDTTTAATLLRHNLLEYAELLLFLLAAMTFVNTLEERNV
ncbi:MAG: sodium:proton antiporter, partial [Gammaproteobacteria bacterium]|nr:sodium:proton antiporter [Gammaproteobacteria bacterium]